MGSVHTILKCESYVDAVRSNLIGGGCNCSRAVFVGAAMGAKFGLDAIPEDWISKTTNHLELL